MDETQLGVVGLIIAAISCLIALAYILHNYGKVLGELKGTKEVIESRLALIEEKYNTSERIQEVELNLKDKVDKKYVDDLNVQLNGLISVFNAEKSFTDDNIKRIEVELKKQQEQQKEDLKSISDDVNKRFQIQAQRHSPGSGGGVI
jgi:hypothetical protein